MDNFDPIDSYVTQVKSNTQFLKKIFFGRPAALTAAVVFGFLMIAAIVTK